MKICAIIPAAGLGSRLNINIPKLLAPISSDKTIWSILREKLYDIVDHINVIASPTGVDLIKETIGTQDLRKNKVSLSIQTRPIGMGDAIFCGYPIWSCAETILIIWGDQVFVSQDTLNRALTTHAMANKTVTLPLVQTFNPYVEYIFNANDTQLIQVKQAREGDTCAAVGFCDVGTFILSTHSLLAAWQSYASTANTGHYTGEINFLPFLPFLSMIGWTIKKVIVNNPIEARGVNTVKDLAFFQQLLAEQSI